MPISENVHNYKQVYSEWKLSGVSVAEFCRRCDITESSFRRWGSQIAIYDIEQQSNTNFIEVDFADKPCKSVCKDSSNIIVKIGRYTQVEIGSEFNVSTFEKVINILGKAVC